MSFTVSDGAGNATVYPYAVKSDRSLPANLREAFKEQQFLRALERDGGGKILYDTVLMVASPVMLVPDDIDIDTTPASIDAAYGEIITGYKGEEKFLRSIPELRVKAVFAVDSDLLLVANDNCSHVTVDNVMALTTITITPTAVTDVINVRASDIVKEVKVYSISGKVMNRFSTDNNEVTLNLGHLAAGVYFVEARTQNDSRTIEQIIKR